MKQQYFSKSYRRLYQSRGAARGVAKGVARGGRRPIGLLGGSFNPPHAGHVWLSRRVAREYRLAAVWWLVIDSNPLKPDAYLPPVAVRAAAARRLVGRGLIKIKPIDGHHPLWHYSYYLLRDLLRRHRGQRFVFIMGSDCLFQLHHWHRWRDLVRLLPLVAMGRPPRSKIYRRARAQIFFRPSAIRRFTHPLRRDSSTALRGR